MLAGMVSEFGATQHLGERCILPHGFAEKGTVGGAPGNWAPLRHGEMGILLAAGELGQLGLAGCRW